MDEFDRGINFEWQTNFIEPVEVGGCCKEYHDKITFFIVVNIDIILTSVRHTAVWVSFLGDLFGK